jgi:hypothetical protein
VLERFDHEVRTEETGTSSVSLTFGLKEWVEQKPESTIRQEAFMGEVMVDMWRYVDCDRGE